MSVTSSRSSNYDETIPEQHFPIEEEMWQPKKVVVKESDPPSELRQSQRRMSVSTENSNSTLALDSPEEEVDLKTPTVPKNMVESTTSTVIDDVHEPLLKPELAGPMEKLLYSLLRQVATVERGHPTIMAEDYDKLQQRVTELEAEKTSVVENYHALLAIRNEDLLNLIKVRDMLAEERREHTAIRKLRDEDLENVLVLREKLAQATWTKPRGSSTTRLSYRQSRTEGDDLWQQAKTAAMEQRILELENANKELRARAQAPAQASGLTGGPTGDIIHRVETMFEEGLKYREKMAIKIQQLRSEKEALQKDVAALEDRNTELEALTERLQRNLDF
ncbi:uncharacterized protein Z518_04327 [Rhinocladiella mackenziei CBS 650.93]|uniref:Uncharacterized protein n=1 Tax=Rhinocladiella mackenziei CBS 650.93 TaxID=1442369 RepID=A0A0D2IT36_9EURO|nr:uncharacterized protein Z518_04327 [Rhinocladiella mackenziei CBS 650.93]KIX06351.1 hypothetical protein Z518_04327 [Rhinocladiella mackenziei CBS 650.93]